MSRRKKRNRTQQDHGERLEQSKTMGEEPGVPEPAAGEALPTEATGPEPDSGATAGAPGEWERLRREAAEMRELAQRRQADFENYRRRMDRERSDLLRHAGVEVVREILPVLDNLERAIQASRSSSEDQFREGVEIIHRQFVEILTRQGLSEVESEGKPFDPHVHEAVSRVATDEQPEGTVVEVLQKGYRFRDRLLRPAMVSVAQPGGGAGESQISPADEEVLRESE